MISKKQLFSLLILLVIWTGCTNTKDGFGYRVFHNTTAKYNGYFYAGESMKEAHKILDEKHVEDYDEILPVFVYGDIETAQSVFPQMERVLEKTQKVIKRHNMDIKGKGNKKMKRPIQNKWIDDNYLLLGQGYFYKKNYFKAAVFFKYIVKKYKDKEIRAQANNWLARVYLETEDWNKVIVSLQLAEKGVESEEIKAETEQLYADYYIRKKEYRKAADHLTKAISLIKKKKDRARPTFILAQLNEKIGNSQEAIDHYENVLSLRPKYELEFYALIHQAMAFNRRGGNSGEIKGKLFKMLKDDKNIEYRDQIYYALADMSFEEQKIPEGIDYLHKSLAAYVDNDKQKGKTFVRLADMYFEEKNYVPAQAYYDSTLVKINEENKRYEEIKLRADNLNELIANINTISQVSEDVDICNSDDDAMIEKLKARQDEIIADNEAKRQAEIAAAEAALDAASGDGGVGMFWPYNAVLKEKGREYFDNVWGSRILEDDWRRKNKTPTYFRNEEEIEVETVEVLDEYYVPTIEELQAELPCDDGEMSTAKASLAKAYYDNGLIYKEKFDDFDPGIESWENLVGTLDDSEYHVMTYYQLYRSYYNREQNGYTAFGCETCSSKHWGDIIRNKYPGSEWAHLVDDPSYLAGKNQKDTQELEAYKVVYSMYSRGKYVDVIQEAGNVIETEPENHLLCRYKLLRAQAIGHMDGMTGQRQNYIDALKEITGACPESEEAEIAINILSNLDGYVNDSSHVKEEKEDVEEEASTVDLENSPFKDEKMIRHYFAIAVPLNAEPKIDFNGMKSTVTDYLRVYNKDDGYKVTSNLFGREFQILLVKTFSNANEATLFKEVFMVNDSELKEINEGSYDIFLVSKNNYLTIFKKRNLPDYILWEKEVYK